MGHKNHGSISLPPYFRGLIPGVCEQCASRAPPMRGFFRLLVNSLYTRCNRGGKDELLRNYALREHLRLRIGSLYASGTWCYKQLIEHALAEGVLLLRGIWKTGEHLIPRRGSP